MTRTPNASAPNNQPAARRTAPAAGGSQWWKAWLLLTSLGVTALGWVAFPEAEHTATSAGASTLAPAPAAAVSVARVPVAGGVARRPTNATALRAIPQRPVFRTPVTRTRRS